MKNLKNLFVVLSVALALAGCQNPFLQLGGSSVSTGAPPSGHVSLPVTPPVEIMQGTGTSSDPFLVYDVATLTRVGTEGEGEGEWGLSKYYLQIADIDMGNAGNWETAGINNGGCFTGTYDGNGKIISNLSSNFNDTNNSFLGLFSINTGTVMNLGLVDAEIDGAVNIGGIVAINWGIIINCSFTGTKGFVKGSTIYVGGITSENHGVVEGCYSEGSFSGGKCVGGVVGLNRGTIKNCYSTGDCEGLDYIGGIAGENRDSLLNCYATGVIRGTEKVGGIAGYVSTPWAVITNNFALNEDIRSSTYTMMGRVFGGNEDTTIANIGFNFANSEMLVNGVKNWGLAPDDLNGQGIIAGDYSDLYWWITRAGWKPGERWDFDDVWEWGPNDRPILQNVGGQ